MFENADEARRHVQAQVEEAQRAAESARRMNRKLEKLRVTARSADQTVAVTLGQSGGLVDIHFLRGASTDHGRLKAALMEANAKARQDLQAEISNLVDGAFGPDSATSRELNSHYSALFDSQVDQSNGRG